MGESPGNGGSLNANFTLEKDHLKRMRKKNSSLGRTYTDQRLRSRIQKQLATFKKKKETTNIFEWVKDASPWNWPVVS